MLLVEGTIKPLYQLLGEDRGDESLLSNPYPLNFDVLAPTGTIIDG